LDHSIQAAQQGIQGIFQGTPQKSKYIGTLSKKDQSFIRSKKHLPPIGNALPIINKCFYIFLELTQNLASIDFVKFFTLSYKRADKASLPAFPKTSIIYPKIYPKKEDIHMDTGLTGKVALVAATTVIYGGMTRTSL
jgi:hypothetical protein